MYFSHWRQCPTKHSRTAVYFRLIFLNKKFCTAVMMGAIDNLPITLWSLTVGLRTAILNNKTLRCVHRLYLFVPRDSCKNSVCWLLLNPAVCLSDGRTHYAIFYTRTTYIKRRFNLAFKGCEIFFSRPLNPPTYIKHYFGCSVILLRFVMKNAPHPGHLHTPELQRTLS